MSLENLNSEKCLFSYYDEEDIYELFRLNEDAVLVGKFYNKLPENYEKLTANDLANNFKVYSKHIVWLAAPRTFNWVFVGFYLKFLPPNIDLKGALKILKMSPEETIEYAENTKGAANEMMPKIKNLTPEVQINIIKTLALSDLGWNFG